MALTVDRNSKEIQAFPIHPGTTVGILTDAPGGSRILHANESGDITFTFSNGNTLTITVVSGMDFATAENCILISSTASVMMS